PQGAGGQVHAVRLEIGVDRLPLFLRDLSHQSIVEAVEGVGDSLESGLLGAEGRENLKAVDPGLMHSFERAAGSHERFSRQPVYRDGDAARDLPETYADPQHKRA